ncbi:MAG: Holliday junction resolvase RuvX [Anaerolineae bacterium]|jgi:putative Holliday junction resolvase
MRLLALDVGDRRIGVAVSDAAGLIATPLTVLRRTSKVKDFSKLAGLLREQGAEKLVVGHPLNADGSAGPQARRVERYVAAMSEALEAEGLSVPIILWNEHGSTQRAQELMIDAGRSAKKRRQRIDAAAAAVILQDYLDEQQSF